MNAQNVASDLTKEVEKHEKEIVTDLGVDRIGYYLGVYGLLALTVVTKLAESIKGH